ncbi:hypothetical protein [Streptomyces avicenniae]|uniref:hypothetical protein n=1 Tax=Streptomyces avicenniae TaxID=500153 RepID=UPI000A9CA4DE|nr:hypothetical protein [Streptomyces avicenniae]
MPAPRRDPNPHITVITGLEGPLPRPVWRGTPATDAEAEAGSGETPDGGDGS